MLNWRPLILLRKHFMQPKQSPPDLTRQELGFVLWDVLTSVSILMILIPVISKMVFGIEHDYDRMQREMEATEQVQLFLVQLQEDVAKSISIQPSGTSVHLVQYDGRTIDLNENPSQSTQHIVRLVNGKGGEIACVYVQQVKFQLVGKSILHVDLDVGSSSTLQGNSYHYEVSLRSYLM